MKKAMCRLMCCLICCLMCCFLGACRQSDSHEDTSTPTPIPTPPEQYDGEIVLKKPNIYLYGYDGEVNITLSKDTEERLLCTYPKYDNGWCVKAEPQGKLTDKEGKTYDYLFWESLPNHDYRVTDGFCVASTDTAAFLEEKLAILGLNDSEIDDFISYWLPEMTGTAYNIISFKTDEYEEYTQMDVNPAPENKVRVLMVWYPWNKKLTINEQVLTPVVVDRTERTVVEWGGVKVGNFGNH